MWKDYFFEVHDTNMRQKRNELMERNKVYYSDLQRYKKAKEAEAEEKRKKREEEKRKIERELEHGPSGMFPYFESTGRKNLKSLEPSKGPFGIFLKSIISYLCYFFGGFCIDLPNFL